MKLVKLIAVITVIAAACNKAEDNSSLNSSDNLFAQQVTYSNLAEIVEGGIAVANGNLDSVKMFGDMMITDHSQAQSELDSIATHLNIQLPSTPDSAHQAMATHLQALSGDEFDTTYIDAQVTDHMNIIPFFNDEVAYGNSQELIAYANKYLPVMQAHLREAQRIREMLH